MEGSKAIRTRRHNKRPPLGNVHADKYVLQLTRSDDDVARPASTWSK